MAEQRTVSLKELWGHVRALDKLISAAWFDTGVPAQISYEDVCKHARSIMDMVGHETSSPHAATAMTPPKAADKDTKADAHKRAGYQRAAADRAPADLRDILGLTHIRKG